MKKFYLLEKERNEEEKKTGLASYRSLVKRYIDDLVLCNNIPNIDSTIWDNIRVGTLTDENDEIVEVYQYFLCNLQEWKLEALRELTDNNGDIIIAYSDLLECEVLMVTHYGTSWDYVLTDIKLTEEVDE